MMENETYYRRLRASVTEAITLAQEADDQFLEWMLGICLAETQEKLKKAVAAKPAKTRRSESEARRASA
jgi:hypothetical protein